MIGNCNVNCPANKLRSTTHFRDCLSFLSRNEEMRAKASPSLLQKRNVSIKFMRLAHKRGTRIVTEATELRSPPINISPLSKALKAIIAGFKKETSD